jgi:fatty-acid O-methyltransferase
MKILLVLLLIPVVSAVVLIILFRFSPGFKRSFGKYFYNWLYGLKWGKARTNNYGYGPAGPEATAYDADEKHQIQLYFEMAASIGLPTWRDKTVLEVGCGRGGGLDFLYQTVKPGHTTGLDFSQNAISYCQQRYAADKDKLHFVQGDATQLPFDKTAFDIVFNVESSHIYSDQAKFLREVARILRPDGRFVIADYRGVGEALQRFRDDLKAAGLVVKNERQISKEVLVACKADSARREALIMGNSPKFAHNYLRNFAMLENTREFEHFERDYYYFIMEIELGSR